jgi:hypothetical protein
MQLPGLIQISQENGYHKVIITHSDSFSSCLHKLISQWSLTTGLIYWLFTVSRPAQKFITLYGDITIAGEGLQTLGLCSVLMAFEQGGIFIVPQLLWHGTSVYLSGLIRRTAPFSRLLRHTKGCGGSILTRILTGIQVIRSIAFIMIQFSSFRLVFGYWVKRHPLNL